MVGETQSVFFKVDTEGLQRAMDRGPSTSYFWLRTHMFRSLLDHRVNWLKSKGPRFGRGKDAIKVWPIQKAPAGRIDPRWVVYRVSPDAKKLKDPKLAARALPKLMAEAHAGSLALEVHQFGTDIDVGSRWLAIPLRRGPRSPKAWRKKFPGRVLVSVPLPGNSQRMYLAERKRYRGRRQDGRRARNKRKKVVRDKLVMRFMLVHRVNMKKTLNFYESWDALASARQKDFASIADRILQDIARGKLT